MSVFINLFLVGHGLKNHNVPVVDSKQSQTSANVRMPFLSNQWNRNSISSDLKEETEKGINKLFPFLQQMDKRAFLPSFIQSIFMILVTELGDKTFS
eukprot:jgi/Galph1/1750/GphlegSOOS_G432.1